MTVLIDMARRKEPVLFVTPGKGKDRLRQFVGFLAEHGGAAGQILEVICEMSPPFLRGIEPHLPGASIAVDWFHIVQLLTRSVAEVPRMGGREAAADPPALLGGAQVRLRGSKSVDTVIRTRSPP